jgi:hypothetical protein
MDLDCSGRGMGGMPASDGGDLGCCSGEAAGSSNGRGVALDDVAPTSFPGVASGGLTPTPLPGTAAVVGPISLLGAAVDGASTPPWRSSRRRLHPSLAQQEPAPLLRYGPYSVRGSLSH